MCRLWYDNPAVKEKISDPNFCVPAPRGGKHRALERNMNYVSSDSPGAVPRGMAARGAYQQVQELLPVRYPTGPSDQGDRRGQRPDPRGAAPGDGRPPGHGIPVRRPGRAVRRGCRARGPQAGGDPVRGLRGQLSGRRLLPEGGEDSGACRRPAVRAAAQALYGKGRVFFRLCDRREGQPDRPHPGADQRQAHLRRPAAYTGDVQIRGLRGG